MGINLNGNISILFYWYKLYTKGFKEEQDYAELKKTMMKLLRLKN